MRPTGLQRMTMVLTALLVSACAGLKPQSDPITFASPSASTTQWLDDGLSFSLNFDAALLQAQDLRKKAELDQASRVLAQLVIAAPNDARVVGEYGKVMLESGKTDDAVAFLERAITLQESDWTLFSALGIAYDQSGKPVAARAAFNHALALKPGEAAVLSNLALSHIQSGDLEEAERLLLQASGQEKGVPGIEEKLAMVRSLKASVRPAPQAADDQIPLPEVAVPAVPAEPLGQPVEDPAEQVSAPTAAPAIETVALPVEPPPPAPIAAVAQPQPAKSTPTREPNAVRPPRKSTVAASLPAPKPSASTNVARVQAKVAVIPTSVTSSQLRVAPSPEPAGVSRAVTRTAVVPLVVTAPPESWETMVRVSVPSPAADHPTAEPPVPAGAPPAAKQPEPPSGWFESLKRWTFAVLGFFTSLWG